MGMMISDTLEIYNVVQNILQNKVYGRKIYTRDDKEIV